mmetsp:Transcript_34042/g.68744  ORF Transcript_34042/g.68744 Transcript_34042/m.68744 type:complete len:280 (-) Transcript_34042:739-1578(-)
MLDDPQLQPCILPKPELPELENEVGPERLDVGLHQRVEQRLGAEGLEPVCDVLYVDEAVLVLRQHLHEPVHLLRAEALRQRLDALAAEAALEANEHLLLALRSASLRSARAHDGLNRGGLVHDRGTPGVCVGPARHVHGRVPLPRCRGVLDAVVEAAAGVLLAALLEGLLQVLHCADDLVVEAMLNCLHRDLDAREPTYPVRHAPLPERLDDFGSHLYEGLALDETLVVLLGGCQEQVYVPFLKTKAWERRTKQAGHLVVGQFPSSVLVSSVENVGQQL